MKITAYFVLYFCSLFIKGVIGDHHHGTFIGSLAADQLIHNVQGDVYVLDDRRMKVVDFSYDGQGPDAFFYYGTVGSVPTADGMKLPDENGNVNQKLGFYNKRTLVLDLPAGVTWKNVKWISVWCIAFEVDFGHVVIPDALVVPTLSTPVSHSNITTPPYMARTPVHVTMESIELSAGIRGGRSGYHLGNLAQQPLNHLVEGDVYVVDDTRLRIEGFSYDGGAPDAFFYYGTAGTKPTGAGNKIPDENGNLLPLGRYDKKTVMLALPLGVMWNSTDIKWISIWCLQFGVDFGYVTVSNSLQVPAPRNVGEFSRLAHGLRSGSVTILDSRRMMIPNLYYDGQGPDAYFYIGNGSAPSANGNKIPDETGSTTKLKAYTGQTIVLTLPDGVTFYDFKWLSVWCILAVANFGHVLIPSDLNVPPYAPDNWNCEKMDDKLQVSWEVKNSNINFKLQGILADSEYMSFGLSGSNSASQMVGGDVVVASYDGTPKAVDYTLSQKAQCANGVGVCPDVQQLGQESFTGISGSRVNGLTTISYTRALNTGDAKDTVIDINKETFVIWAIGRLNPDKIATKHDTRSIGNVKIQFGRTPAKNCPAFTVATGTPAPVTPWKIPPLSGQTTKEFTARIGQTGGARGYSAITGTNSWGIAWYINDLLIPEITLKRNETYTFIVEGGANDSAVTGLPLNTARYHPFYITDDKDGGYYQLSQAKKQQVKVFAGVSPNGELEKEAVGKLCEWTVKQGVDATNKPSFEEFFKTLELKCDTANNNTSGRLTWTPDSNTPDLVYYQCYTHRYLGWKIHVVDDYVSQVSTTVPTSRAPAVKSGFILTLLLLSLFYV